VSGERSAGGIGWREHLRRLVTFFGTSAVALVLEFALFFVLTLVGWMPFFANLVASLTAATLAYALNTRYSFRVMKRPTTYVLYVVYALFIIFSVSAVIQVSIDLVPLHPLVWKVFYAGITFVLNFFFNAYLFRRERALPGYEPGDAEAGVVPDDSGAAPDGAEAPERPAL
jgi:putative flippase GtrA